MTRQSATRKPKETVPVLMEQLQGTRFEDATCGRAYMDGDISRPGFHPPKLKYYYPFLLPTSKDLRVLWVASLPAVAEKRSDRLRRQVVGLLELETSPFDADVAWLKYVSVDPAYQRQGIAKRMLEGMVQHLQMTGQLLERSRPSEEGELKIQAYIDNLLDSHGIRWTQSGRDGHS